jgi:HlyD family secretion protein
VELGQTVNAGMSAPTLFTIAGDLTKMRILVSVDEADIGKVHKDQTARFTVPAFGERRFEGKVEKVRLQSATVESVVTYTVEVSVDNADKVLLPGMTATVELVTAEATGVLCAPNAALRLSPEPAQRVPSARESADASGGSGGSGGWGGHGKGRGGPKRLWTIADGGLLAPVEVTVGLQGSTCTEVSGDGITEGMQIVLGQQPTGASGGSSSPFQSQQPQGGWRGPRPGGF